MISLPNARILAVMLGLLMAAPLQAFEATLQLPDAAKELQTKLANASLVIAAKKEGTTNPQDILAAAQADYARVVGALYAQGYYGPSVSIRVDGREAAEVPPLTRLQSVSRVVLRVEPGPEFTLGRAQIGPLASGTELPEGFVRGAPAPSTIVGDAARAGITGWRKVGHAKAQVAGQDITADHRRRQLDVALKLAPGPVVRLGRLRVSGSRDVREARIRAIAGIPEGVVFDPEILRAAAKRLRRTGAFSSVALREAETLGPGATLDLDLKLADAKPRRFGFGAELLSSEGLALSGFWLHRNLLGGAERLRIEGEVSGIDGNIDGLDYRLAASYTRPATFTANTDLFVVAELERLDEPLFLSRRAGLQVGVNHIFSDTLTGKAALALRYEEIEDDLGEREFTHLSMPLGLTWDRRDDPLDATKGSYLGLETEPFFGLRGSKSGLRVYADLRGYRAVGADDRLVLAARVQLGSVIGPSIEDTPSDYLFFAGGSNTVRGHPYQSLAVTRGNVRTGGRSFFGVSGEARLNVAKKVQVVAFYDAGYVGADSRVGSDGDWHSGAGLGLRYKTGIGPIRLDVAAPVSGRDSSGVQLYIGIGQAF